MTRRNPKKLAEHYARLREEGSKPNVHSDFSRLARMIRGCSVGLVLGGGGARGCSHVGMIKVKSLLSLLSRLSSLPLTDRHYRQYWRPAFP